MTPPMVPRRYRVRWRRRETADTVTLHLDPLDGSLPTFAPGQFAMLYAFGIGEIAISVSAVPADGTLVHTVRAVGAVSRAICAAQRARLTAPTARTVCTSVPSAGTALTEIAISPTPKA